MHSTLALASEEFTQERLPTRIGATQLAGSNTFNCPSSPKITQRLLVSSEVLEHPDLGVMLDVPMRLNAARLGHVVHDTSLATAIANLGSPKAHLGKHCQSGLAYRRIMVVTWQNFSMQLSIRWFRLQGAL